ncbi:hypothetical protein IWQ51_004139 [Labrenzia sp. EL_142]|nr:hypothetical protein [Labrenzia sp. EL_142]
MAKKLVEYIDWSTSLVPVAQMTPFGVAVNQPLVEVGLEGFDAFIERFAHLDAEELVQDRAVKALDKPIGFGVFTLVRLCSMPLRSR